MGDNGPRIYLAIGGGGVGRGVRRKVKRGKGEGERLGGSIKGQREFMIRLESAVITQHHQRNAEWNVLFSNLQYTNHLIRL